MTNGPVDPPPALARILLANRVATTLNGTTDAQGRYLVVEALATTPSSIIQSVQPYQIHVHLFDMPGGTRLMSLSWPISAGHELEHIVAVLQSHISTPANAQSGPSLDGVVKAADVSLGPSISIARKYVPAVATAAVASVGIALAVMGTHSPPPAPAGVDAGIVIDAASADR